MPNLKKAIENLEARLSLSSFYNESDKNILSCLKAYERDRERLNWLSKNEWDFYHHDCFQLNWDAYSFARHSLRQSIDSAMKVSEGE